MWSHSRRAKLRPAVSKGSKHPTLPVRPVIPDLGVVISARTQAYDARRTVNQDDQELRSISLAFLTGILLASALILSLPAILESLHLLGADNG